MAVPLASAPAESASPSPARGHPRRQLRDALLHPLWPILLLAALLRVWGLGGHPVLYFDSGVYLGEGQFLASAAERAASALVQPAADAPVGALERVARAVERGTLAHPPDIGKPGHAVLLALAMLAVGKTAFAGMLVSALAGVGTVAATYALGTLGWGRGVGVLAALFLAVSGQHLVYSREPLVESDGMLFATLGALVYLRGLLRSQPSLRSLALAGLLFGVAFSANNRFSYWPAALLPLEIGRWRELGWREWRGVALRALVVGLAFAAPLIALEVSYLGARLAGRAAGVATNWLDYAQQLAAFTRMNPPDRLRPDEWPTYYVDVILMDGPLVLALAVVGVAVALRRHARPDLLLLGSFLVPLALYSVYSTGEVRMRHFSLALPWLMLAAAIGLATLASRGTRAGRPSGSMVVGTVDPSGRTAGAPLTRRAGRVRVLLATLVVGAMLATAVPRDLALVLAPNGWPALLRYLDQRDIQRVASTNGPVLGALIGEERTNARLRAAFINTPADLDAVIESYPYLVVEMQAYVFPGELTRRYDKAPPLLAVPHGSSTWYLADLLEHYGVPWGRWDRLLQTWEANRESATTLRLFDTRSLAVAP